MSDISGNEAQSVLHRSMADSEVTRFIGNERLDRGRHCQDVPSQLGRLVIERSPNTGDRQLPTVHADLSLLEVRIQLEELWDRRRRSTTPAIPAAEKPRCWDCPYA